MNTKARILVVDDSTVARGIVRRALELAPDMTVVDTAQDGKVALQRIAELAPDAVTLDIEMPVMDGLETLERIRQKYPKLPVVMFSSLTTRGAEATVEALLRGADAYVAKPSNVSNREEATRIISEELVPKLRALLPRAKPSPATQARSPSVNTAVAARPAKRGAGGRPEVLVIGSSTGGPAALLEVLRNLPANFRLPIAITQHMPPKFTAMLAKRLDSETPFSVSEAVDGERMRVGHVWVAPGEFHMVLEKTAGGAKVRLNDDPPVHSCRPAVDPLFHSAAKIFGSGCMGVVLTGMGQDGLAGSRSIKQAGGQILVQDEASSVVWGMPGFVAREGLADAVLPLTEVAQAIADRALPLVGLERKVTRAS